MTAIKSVVADAKRIVIKVGTALLTDNGRGLDEKAIANLAEELSAVQKLGREVVLVSSGSIAEGVRRLGWDRRPTEVGVRNGIRETRRENRADSPHRSGSR